MEEQQIEQLKQWIEIAETHFKNQEYNEAIAFFRKALMIDPKIAWVQFGLGASLIKIGKANDAIGHLLKAIELDPDEPEFYVGLGEYYFQKRQFDYADYNFGKAVSLGTNNFGALNNYGILLLEYKNSPQEAIPILKRVMEANPANPLYRKNYIRAVRTSHPLYNFLFWKKNRIRMAIFYLIWLMLMFGMLAIGEPSKLKAYLFLIGVFVIPALFQFVVQRIASRETSKNRKTPSQS